MTLEACGRPRKHRQKTPPDCWGLQAWSHACEENDQPLPAPPQATLQPRASSLHSSSPECRTYSSTGHASRSRGRWVEREKLHPRDHHRHLTRVAYAHTHLQVLLVDDCSDPQPRGPSDRSFLFFGSTDLQAPLQTLREENAPSQHGHTHPLETSPLALAPLALATSPLALAPLALASRARDRT